VDLMAIIYGASGKGTKDNDIYSISRHNGSINGPLGLTKGRVKRKAGIGR
jgi:hypothetical protein